MNAINKEKVLVLLIDLCNKQNINMRTKIALISILVCLGVLVNIYLSDIVWKGCTLSGVLLIPISMCGVYIFVSLFKSDNKNAVTNVWTLTAGIILALFLGTTSLEWEEYLLKSISAILGAILLLLYIKKIHL